MFLSPHSKVGVPTCQPCRWPETLRNWLSLSVQTLGLNPDGLTSEYSIFTTPTPNPLHHSSEKSWKELSKACLVVWAPIVMLMQSTPKRKNAQDPTPHLQIIWSHRIILIGWVIVIGSLVSSCFCYCQYLLVLVTAHMDSYSVLRFSWTLLLWRLIKKVHVTYSELDSESHRATPRCPDWRHPCSFVMQAPLARPSSMECISLLKLIASSSTIKPCHFFSPRKSHFYERSTLWHKLLSCLLIWFFCSVLWPKNLGPQRRSERDCGPWHRVWQAAIVYPTQAGTSGPASASDAGSLFFANLFIFSHFPCYYTIFLHISNMVVW